MADKDFEKKVQELMVDLNIPPSDAVWPQVEARIKSSKRRRIIFWLVPLAAVTIIGGSLLVFISNHGNERGSNIAVPGNNVPGASLQQKSTNSNSSNAVAENHQTEKAAPREPGTQPSEGYQNKMRSGASNNEKQNRFIQRDPLTIKQNDGYTGIQQATANATNDATTATTGFQADKAGVEPGQAAPPPGDNAAAVSTDIVITKMESEKAASYQQMTDINKKTSSDPTPPVAAKNQQQHNKLSKFTWGLDMFYGRADAVKSLAGNAEQSARYSQAPGNLSGGYVIQSPAQQQVKAAASFSIGVAVAKDISKRSSISTGLAYARQQTKFDAGKGVDSVRQFYNGTSISTADGYYRSVTDTGAHNTITNKYSFISLPVSWNYRFNNSSKLPLYLHTGITLNAMVGSDAWVYDWPNGVYYQDKSVFNKIQANLLFGVSAKFNLKQSALLVGPQMQYSISNLTKSKDYYGNAHLFNYGLHATLLLKKK